MIDLIVLLPCQPYEQTVQGLFSRPEALNVRPFTYEIIINIERDPGCRCKSVSYLRPYINTYDNALVLFDLEGCGVEDITREQVEESIETDLARNGWADRSAVVVVDPEIEAWVWSDSPHVEATLNWGGRQPDIRTWLKSETEFWQNGTIKPQRPKEAMRQALQEVRTPMSSNMFKELAENISVNRCIDPAFRKLKDTIVNWFSQ